MKRTILLFLILSLGLLAGCDWLLGEDVGTLTLSVPDSIYPGDEVTIRAAGVVGGQFIFTVDGETYTPGSSTLTVTIEAVPCEVSVTWENGGVPQTVTKTIVLRNAKPVIGRPMLKGIANEWTVQPRHRYMVTFPGTYDPEGGPVTLINVTVWHTGQQAYQAIFCPPYVGDGDPKPDLYRVRTGQGDIFNAFVFYGVWEQVLDTETPGWTLPFPPPSQSEDSYPGRGVTCPPFWPTKDVPAGVVIITATFEDEMGARAIRIDEIPVMHYYAPSCQTDSVCL